jgi:hypothetical protein
MEFVGVSCKRIVSSLLMFCACNIDVLLNQGTQTHSPVIEKKYGAVEI